MKELITPVGRMIGGDLYKMFPVKDNFGKPKMSKDGVTPAESMSMGVAIPKGAETHWNQTEWGAQIWSEGQTAYPQAFAAPAFAWKITNGDSVIPNKRGITPVSREGYPGHWVMWLSQTWFPRIVSADGSVELAAGAVLPGYYVRVLLTVKGNAPSPSPGVYLNPKAVSLAGEGELIETSSQVDTSVFAATPAGKMPVGARPVAAAEPAFAGVTATPNPAFLLVPPPPLVHRMTPLAGGATYEAMITAGWSDALLVQHGMMLP